jgi:hypothetical protein
MSTGDVEVLSSTSGKKMRNINLGVPFQCSSQEFFQRGMPKKFFSKALNCRKDCIFRRNYVLFGFK